MELFRLDVDVNWWAALILLILGTAVAMLNYHFGIVGGHDSRAGTPNAPRRSWLAEASYPKSWVHLVETFGLALIGWVWTLPILIAVGIALAVMAGYEWSQKHFDPVDLFANAVGGAAAILVVFIGSLFI